MCVNIVNYSYNIYVNFLKKTYKSVVASRVIGGWEERSKFTCELRSELINAVRTAWTAVHS